MTVTRDFSRNLNEPLITLCETIATTTVAEVKMSFRSESLNVIFSMFQPLYLFH